jgi:hypothetical protein
MSICVKPLVLGACACVLFASCGGPKGPPRKDTYPLKGVVYVDGKPAADCGVFCVKVSDVDATTPPSSGRTKEDGSFEISTYQKSDGIPEGDYVLTFEWKKFNAISMNYGGPDKLGGRYSNPKKSEKQFKVEKGKQTDLGKIELKTK